MTFLYPNVLYALILPALLAAAAWWLWRRRSRKWEVLVSPEYRRELVHAPATWHRVLPVIFAVLASIFAILSIARPVDGYTEVKEIPKSRNILIAIDCSRSMLSKDASPTRLGRAKTAAYDLLDALPGDNFGIIIFSGDAVLLMPLTHDHNALKETIEQLQFGWVSQGGTNLENVVRLALQTFKRDKEADAKNALVILSDGEDTVNITYKTAEAARQHQLIIVTAGIGTTIGTTIPDEQSPSGLYRDRRGQHVVSKLNPESLQYLARQTGGQYVQLSDGAALNRFVKDIADRLDTTEGKEEVRRVPNDRYIIFAVPALICLLLTLLAGTRWRSFRRSGRRGMTALTAAALFCAGLLSQEAQADTHALDNVTDLIRTGKTEEAVKSIDEMLAVPDLAEEMRQALEFAKGCLEQKADNPKEAAEAFSQALLSPKPALQADSHFNLGNLEAAQARKTMTFSRPEGEQQQARLSSIDDQIKEIDALVGYGRTPYHTMGLSPDPKEDEEKIRRAMEITHTYKHRDKPVSELSGGQKQRVWIAMALAQDTKVLFLDEPTTYLDIRYQLQILKLIRQLNREYGITIVMVLHDINQSLYYSDEIVAMKDGRMIAHGLPEEIISGELVQEVYDVNLDIRTVDGKPFVIPV